MRYLHYRYTRYIYASVGIARCSTAPIGTGSIHQVAHLPLAFGAQHVTASWDRADPIRCSTIWVKQILLAFSFFNPHGVVWDGGLTQQSLVICYKCFMIIIVIVGLWNKAYRPADRSLCITYIYMFMYINLIWVEVNRETRVREPPPIFFGFSVNLYISPITTASRWEFSGLPCMASVRSSFL